MGFRLAYFQRPSSMQLSLRVGWGFNISGSTPYALVRITQKTGQKNPRRWLRIMAGQR
ncbi:uncharacterized protein CTRU02_209149 [Colletotrichum truncatum]|uniref:Uncharacterized protein n=1 Tax=Colletotrichum truncatum TaxID=5467 RepID=A0ACC3YY87_COLTU|nr:uncharacterized protein CTRU02_14543 [Colletotrichum truncatum]KAF6782099.1 hypothetical protein CTRU02_14543 [Colletotrichum truncatum]